jgi:hypothetical protein
LDKPPYNNLPESQLGRVGQIIDGTLFRTALLSALMRGWLLLACLLVPVGLSGCLADDIWREPFVWRDVVHAGENVDAAQAFGAAFGDGPERAGATAGNEVIGKIEDFPNTVYFQNLKDFMENQAPGRGDEFEQGVRDITTTAGDGYRTLTAQVADAWAENTGSFASPSVTQEIVIPERTTRVRLVIDAAIAQSAAENGGNPTPLGNLRITWQDPRGAMRASYQIDTTRHIDDLFVVGTFGDGNEVREHLGGQWLLDVSATGEGAWSVVIDAYQPEHADYEWWQFWRGEARGASA